MNDNEFEEIISRVLDRADAILQKPDVDTKEIYEVMNQLSSYALRLRIMAISADKQQATNIKEVARGITDLVGVLKYQAKDHIESKFMSK